jgi:hypothetical protein
MQRQLTAIPGIRGRPPPSLPPHHPRGGNFCFFFFKTGYGRHCETRCTPLLLSPPSTVPRAYHTQTQHQSTRHAISAYLFQGIRPSDSGLLLPPNVAREGRVSTETLRRLPRRLSLASATRLVPGLADCFLRVVRERRAVSTNVCVPLPPDSHRQSQRRDWVQDWRSDSLCYFGVGDLKSCPKVITKARQGRKGNGRLVFDDGSTA